MVLTVPKIGKGTDADPIRPQTTSTWWQVIEEKAKEFVIMVFN